MEKTVFLEISYLGKEFFGSQRQKGLHTAQETIEGYLSKIYNKPIKVHPCSRLDKDVSAYKWGVSFKTDDSLSLSRLKYSLNRLITERMHVNNAIYVNDDFFPRKDAYLKTYLYTINLGEFNPISDFCCFLPPFKIDEEKFVSVLPLFKGKHDFSLFSSDEDFSKEDKMKTVSSLKYTYKDGYLKIYISGPGFLRYQVRFIIGACYLYSLGKISKEEIVNRLNGIDDDSYKYKAPGIGLALYDVKYKKREEK